MAEIVMPKATAVWLIDNTILTFEQIAAFCDLVPLEVQAIADEEVAVGIIGVSPITTGILTQEEIERCQKDKNAKLTKAKSDQPEPARRVKGKRYTPLAKRGEKPEGILWLAKTYPELSNGQVGKLIGSTAPTVKAIREGTHRLSNTLRGRDAVALGLVRADDLEKTLHRARKKAGLPLDGNVEETAQEQVTG